MGFNTSIRPPVSMVAIPISSMIPVERQTCKSYRLLIVNFRLSKISFQVLHELLLCILIHGTPLAQLLFNQSLFDQRYDCRSLVIGINFRNFSLLARTDSILSCLAISSIMNLICTAITACSSVVSPARILCAASLAG